MDQAVLQEAHLYRKEIVEGLTTGSPGGNALAPLAPSTLATRRARGIRGTKPPHRARRSAPGHLGGFARRAACSWASCAPRAAATASSSVNVAKVHELGKVVVFRMTEKSRRYVAMMMRKAGVPPTGQSNKGGIVVVKIPARPFIRPVFEKLSKGAPERVMKRVVRLLTGTTEVHDHGDPDHHVHPARPRAFERADASSPSRAPACGSATTTGQGADNRRLAAYRGDPHRRNRRRLRVLVREDAGGTIATCLTPPGTLGSADVLLQNLDGAGEPIAGEAVLLPSAFTYERPALATESSLTRLVRTLLRALKAQIIENVNPTVHTDFDASPEDGLHLAAVARLPALVLAGPELRQNRAYSLNQQPVRALRDGRASRSTACHTPWTSASRSSASPTARPSS